MIDRLHAELERLRMEAWCGPVIPPWANEPEVETEFYRHTLEID